MNEKFDFIFPNINRAKNTIHLNHQKELKMKQ